MWEFKKTQIKNSPTQGLKIMRLHILFFAHTAHWLCNRAATANYPAVCTKKKPLLIPRPSRTFCGARFAEVAGQRDRAIEELQAAVQYDSTSATLYSTLARNLNAVRRFQDAVEPARRSVHIDPKNVQTRWLYYHALSRGLRDTTTAIDQLNAIVRLAPRDLSAYHQLLQIYNARGAAQQSHNGAR